MPGIFLNFRSADAGSYAAALLDEVLGALFTPDLVFRSSRTIPAGAKFDDVLLDGVRTADVLLVLIGPDWLEGTDAEGTRLLEREDDWVRREIAIGLGRGIPVIPVLLTGAQRPGAGRLPEDIAALADRQAVYLRHRHIGPDLAHLLGEVAKVAPGLEAPGLFAPATSLPEDHLPSMLLRPEYQVVPFGGRQAELDDLLEWGGGDVSLAARLVTGPAGQGKTRLALRLAELLREQGWLAGVVAEDADPGPFARIASLPTPLLLVVDYAEARTGFLGDLVKVLTARPRTTPVRLLLLARTGGEWWQELREHGDDRVAAVFLRAVEQSLPPLANRSVDRHAEFARAVAALGFRLPSPAENIDPPPGLETSRFERALDVHAAALAGLLDVGAPDGRSDPRADPVARVLHHERRYWRRTASAHRLPGPDRARLDAVVSVATLYGAEADEDAVELLGRLRTFERESRAVLTGYLRWLQSLYPGPQAMNALRPDRLGEDLVAATIAGQPSVAVAPAVGVDDPRLRQALTVLGRGAPRHPVVHDVLGQLAATTGTRFADLVIAVAPTLEDPRPLVDVLERTVAGSTDARVLGFVRGKLPQHTVALAQLAASVEQRELAAHLRLPDRDPAVTAHLLVGVAERLRQLGNYAGMLKVITEAAETYRRLARDDRDAYLPNFVSALQMLSVCLSDLGRNEEALEHAQTAVAGFRELARERPDAYDAELGNALNGLSNRLKALGERKAAFEAAVEASQLFMRAWDAGAARHVMPDLARALNNLAVHANAVGEAGLALDALADAVGLRRRLAESSPDAYLADLAGSLNNRANLLEDAGRYAEAASTTEEAVEIYRRLAEHRPAVFRPDLAMALNNHSINLNAAGDAENALLASAECVELYRSLAFPADLAMALNTYSQRLARAGRAEDALAAVTESVELRRALLPTTDREVLSGLVASLSNQGIRLREQARYEEAATAAREAVALSKRLVAEEPGYAPRLGDALNSLALAEKAAGDRSRSAAAAREAVEVYRPLHDTQPAAYRRRLISALANQADALGHGDPSQAAVLLSEARSLADPDADSALLSHITTLSDSLDGP
ncbi:tetratricopeptide repeat protein [Amycolatopsis sp. cmx-4-68]|uniref:tetratricopeptide repeat protein n=1 Tax=Amycolatopsis sp. cmx-4-68 TaxID=2790938 RepID=UPI00397AE1DD